MSPRRTSFATVRLHGLLALSVAVILPIDARAQQSDASKKSILFLESVAIPKKARICAAHIEGFDAQFELAYAKWVKTHQTELAEGEALLRSEAEKTFTPFEQNVQAVTSLSAQMLGKASQAVIQENCQAMLIKLGAMPAPLGASQPDPAH